MEPTFPANAIDDPVFRDFTLLVFDKLIAIITPNAFRRNHFNADIGRAIHIGFHEFARIVVEDDLQIWLTLDIDRRNTHHKWRFYNLSNWFEQKERFQQ